MTTVPLSRASTLPSRYYVDPDLLEVEKERIFGRTWQLVTRAEELARVGDFVPVTVLDEPVVITHGIDGELGAFYNVCRHRAGQVALARGNRKSLQCRYHGWTYGLDGTLRACPEMEETEEFRKEDFGLLPVRVDRWGPFVFVNLSDDAPPLRDVLAAIPSEVERAGFDVERMRLVERREYVVEQLEGVCRQLPGGLPPPDRAPPAVQGARLRRLSGRGVPLLLEAARPDSRAEAGGAVGRRSAVHAPTRRGGFGPLLLALPEHDVQHLPGQHVLERHPATGRGSHPHRLRVVLRRAGDRFGLGEHAADDRVFRRDPAGGHRHLRAGAAGLRSRAYDTGRFSAKRENGVYHFQNLVREFLGEGSP